MNDFKKWLLFGMDEQCLIETTRQHKLGQPHEFPKEFCCYISKKDMPSARAFIADGTGWEGKPAYIAITKEEVFEKDIMVRAMDNGEFTVYFLEGQFSCVSRINPMQ